MLRTPQPLKISSMLRKTSSVCSDMIHNWTSRSGMGNNDRIIDLEISGDGMSSRSLVGQLVWVKE